MKRKEELDVSRVIHEFEKLEQSKDLRKGAFKIDAPFEEAVKSITKVKPNRKKSPKG